MATSRQVGGGLLVVGAATGYGLLPLFATEARRAGLDTVTVLAIRFTLAAAALWLLVAVRRPAVPPRRVLAAVLAVGASCWTVQAVGYFVAVARLGASLAALLLYTYPLLVVAVAVLAGRQRWHRMLAVASGLVVTGLALVFGVGTGGTRLDPLGAAAGVTAAVTYSAFILLSEPLSQRVDAFLFTALTMTGAAAATVGVTVARGGVPFGAVTHAGAALLALALVSTVAAAVAFLSGLRRIGAATTAILSCTEVVVACTVAATALGDRLSPIQLAGCAAIVAAVVVLNAGQNAVSVTRTDSTSKPCGIRE